MLLTIFSYFFCNIRLLIRFLKRECTGNERSVPIMVDGGEGRMNGVILIRGVGTEYQNAAASSAASRRAFQFRPTQISDLRYGENFLDQFPVTRMRYIIW
jgi:hypothetical protein